MLTRHRIRALTLALAAGLLATAAQAERSQRFGEYEVHYNAFNAALLQPAVATQYGILRSGQRAVLNVSVLRGTAGPSAQPVAARVSGNATNLSGQRRDLSFREVREGEAIYYIADFRITNEEQLEFVLDVQPEGAPEPGRLQFRQTFFVE